jgi:cytochrome b
MPGPEQDQIVVWDPLVRIGHWVLVIAFVVAYLTEGDPILIHVWAGYTIGGYLLLRVIWGFAGPLQARFSAFLYPPAMVLGYLRDLVGFRARRYLGHSPAGGVMVVALLLALTATVATGLLAYGGEKHAGPLVFLFPGPAASEPVAGDDAAARFPSRDDPAPAPAAEGPSRRAESELVELHETFVNVTLVLVILHVAGVILASFAHRENLVRAMVTGRKRAE